jgi:pimeloyl-ACP methyl ester carboxylesterase
MTTFALIHGGGGSAFDWHLVEAGLRDRGHDTVAVDLPTSDPQAGLWDYADAVVRAAGALVMVTAMIPSPGEPPADWWERTGHPAPGIEDEYELYLHDVPRELGERVLAHDGALAEKMNMDRAYNEPWPLAAWPDVPTRYLLCRDDRFFTPEFARRHVKERLGVTPDEMPGSHMVMLSRPGELADYLVRVLPAG